MTDLISKLRQACHDERSKNREAAEAQLYALQLCADVEKYLMPWIRLKAFFTEDNETSELHAKNRY
jgi:hypothetical protein